MNDVVAIPFLALLFAAVAACGMTARLTGCSFCWVCCGCCSAQHLVWRAVLRWRLAGRGCNGGECWCLVCPALRAFVPAACPLDCLLALALRCLVCPLSMASGCSLACLVFAGVPLLAHVCSNLLLCPFCLLIDNVCLPARTNAWQKIWAMIAVYADQIFFVLSLVYFNLRFCAAMF